MTPALLISSLQGRNGMPGWPDVRAQADAIEGTNFNITPVTPVALHDRTIVDGSSELPEAIPPRVTPGLLRGLQTLHPGEYTGSKAGSDGLIELSAVGTSPTKIVRTEGTAVYHDGRVTTEEITTYLFADKSAIVESKAKTKVPPGHRSEPYEHYIVASLSSNDTLTLHTW